MAASADSEKTAIIIGAGPAGLTAAYELLKRTDIRPIVLEQGEQVGGLSRTVDYKGNKIDIGGHRFFSKSKRVTDWWERFLPTQGPGPETEGLPVSANGPDPAIEDKVMLMRRRLSRIFFLGKFFSYPLELSLELLRLLGIRSSFKIGASYLHARARPIAPERSLEDFLVNRFGRALYKTFFKDYTEKLWGVPCSSIKPDWGAQRIKGLSLRTAVLHALRGKDKKGGNNGETSLIGHFHYPKFGPGQMWETVAAEIEKLGGRILLDTKVTRLVHQETRVVAVHAMQEDGSECAFGKPDWVFSSMPIKELFPEDSMSVPQPVREVARGLLYRDFVTVGILCAPKDPESALTRMKDNWLYIQEPGVKLGRVQIFNNWSPYLVLDPDKMWLGLEYFANEGDAFWNLSDKELADLARNEISQIGILHAEDILDCVVIRQPKAYPAYFGSYDRLDVVRNFVDQVENLILLGRNGMHRYNNQDHSMLSAMTAVDVILDPSRSKTEVWQVNVEDSYQEGAKK